LNLMSNNFAIWESRIWPLQLANCICHIQLSK
jgi:hypothetical protein